LTLVFFSPPAILRESDVQILSLRSRRQNKPGVKPKAEPQEYSISAHQAREAGDSFLLFAV
jgi:hypothetical protein